VALPRQCPLNCLTRLCTWSVVENLKR